MKTINILIADDHELIHVGISNILKSYHQFRIIGHAYNGTEALELAGRDQPDVILMDISMPVMNGIEATRAILEKYPGIRIILLTQHDDLEYVRQAVKSGGLGYMLKNSQGKDFLEAIETVMQNKRYLSREIAEQIIDNTIRTDITGDSEPSLPLTRREVEIIRKIAEGKNNHTIAEELFISIRTVETHRRNLMQKLQLHSAVALVHYATRHGIIDIRNT